MAETILVHIKGDEKDFVRATGRAGQAGKKFGGGMKALKIGLVAAAAAMTAMIVITKKLMKSFTEHALKIDKINKVTGIACEDLQRWGYVAEQEHGNFETLTKSFTILAQRVVDADQGLETYTREFRKMGIALRDGQGNLRDVNDIFMDMGDYAKTATNQTEAMGTMGKILGSRYVKDLLPMLKLSREEIERLGDEAERLGIVLDTKTIRAAKAFDDKMTKLKNRMKGVGLEIAEKVLPALDKIANAFDTSGKGTEGFADSIGNLADSIADFISGEGQNFLNFLQGCISGISIVMDYIGGITPKERLREKLLEMPLEEMVKIREDTKASLEITKEEAKEASGFRKKALRDVIKAGEARLEFIREIERYRRTHPQLEGETLGPFQPEAKPIVGAGGVSTGGAGAGKAVIPARLAELEAGTELMRPYHEGLVQIAEDLDNVRVAEEGLSEILPLVIGDLGRLTDIGRDMADDLFKAFEGLWDDIFDPMLAKMDVAETAWGKFGADIVKDLANMLKQIASKVLIGGLTLAAIVTLLNLIPPTFSIGTGIMALLTGMTKTEAGAAIEKGGGGFKGTVKGLLGMQEGGYVGGKQPYIVGEGGPELFVPQAPGEIISNDALNRLASAMRPPTAPAGALGSHNTFVIEGDSAEIIAAITRIYQKAPRQQQTAYGASVSQHSAELAESV